MTEDQIVEKQFTMLQKSNPKLLKYIRNEHAKAMFDDLQEESEKFDWDGFPIKFFLKIKRKWVKP